MSRMTVVSNVLVSCARGPYQCCRWRLRLPVVPSVLCTLGKAARAECRSCPVCGAPSAMLVEATASAAGRVQCAAHPRQSRPSRLSVVSRVVYTVDHVGWAACAAHRGPGCMSRMPDVSSVLVSSARSPCQCRWRRLRLPVALVCCASSAKPIEPTVGRVQGPLHRRPCGLGRLPVVSSVTVLRIVGQAA